MMSNAATASAYPLLGRGEGGEEHDHSSSGAVILVGVNNPPYVAERGTIQREYPAYALGDCSELKCATCEILRPIETESARDRATNLPTQSAGVRLFESICFGYS